MAFKIVFGIQQHWRFAPDQLSVVANLQWLCTLDGVVGARGRGVLPGWLKAGGRDGGLSKSAELRMNDVRTVDDKGEVGEVEAEEEIPDMDDEEDDEEAIIRDTSAGKGSDG